MADLLSDVARHIRREALLKAKEPVRVAVSGGIDSMVLLHVLGSLGHPCVVAHVDHGLRGSESDDDLAFVRETCLTAAIPFLFKSVDVPGRVRARGVSIQMAARELRYAWFQELRCTDPMPIALGHHADDAVETLVLGLMRGVGAQGWAGMRPANDGFIRPLLFAGREDIIRYAQEHAIRYREDSSNADPKYLRNRVRLDVLPLLESSRPGALRSIARSLTPLRELERLAGRRIAEECMDLRPDGEGVLRVPFDRIERSEAPHLFLLHLLRERGFHPDTIERVREAVAEQATGSVFSSTDHMLNIDRHALLISPAHHARPVHTIEEFAPPSPDGPFAWSYGTSDEPAGILTPDRARLDAERLTFPLELRPWRHGDRIRPIGLGGSKLVSDLLIDAKVPMTEKEDVYVLVSSGTVVWVCGHRVAEGFQATSGTRWTFVIEQKPRVPSRSGT